MTRRLLVPLLAVLVFGLTVGSAGVATALPGYSSLCSNCHSASSSISVGATAGTANASTTQYTISVSNSANAASIGWAVFNGSTKVSAALGSGTSISLTNGVTYTIIGAGLDGSGNQIAKSISVTPLAPAPVLDTTAPITTSNALATYLSSASITLTANDNVGGSGVAHTYYILDSGTQTEGTTVNTSVVGTHTLEFWSVDASANVETPHNFANFEVTAPIPDTTAPVTTSDAKASYVAAASIKLTATDNVGGSGVAHTYYVLDGAAQAEGTTVNTSVVGTHTLEFWSEDASANVEAPHNFADFAVTAAPPAAKKYTVTYKFKLKKGQYKKNLKAVLTSQAAGHKRYVAAINKKGVATFKNMPAGRYKLSTTGGARFKFKARIVRIGPA